VAALDKQQLSSLLDGPREKDTIVALYAPWCQFCKVGPGGVRLWCLCLCCVLLWWPVVLVVLCVLPAGMSLFIYAKERLSLGPCSLILLACSLSCLACSHCTFPPSSNSTFQALEPQYAELADQLAGSHVSVAKFQADTEREFAADKFGLKTFPTLVLLPKGSKGGE
jgi:thiol-disulfide isomerase/thioredoxin